METVQKDSSETVFRIIQVDQKPLENGKSVRIPEAALSFVTLKPPEPELEVGSLSFGAFQTSVILAGFGPRLTDGTVLRGVLYPLSQSLDNMQDFQECCEPFTPELESRIFGKILLVKRGRCTFGIKAFWAERAGASGLLVLSEDDTLFSMTNSKEPWDHGKEDGVDMTSIPVGMLPKSVGEGLLKHLQALETSQWQEPWTLQGSLTSFPRRSFLYVQEKKIENLWVIPKVGKDPQGLYRRKKLKKGLLDPGQSFKSLLYCPLQSRSCL